MRPGPRLIFDLLVRLALLFFAVWFVVTPDAIPGAPLLARIGIASVFLVLMVVTGEIQSIRSQMSILLATLLKARGEREPTDDRAAVDILVRAMGTSTGDTREKVHRQLRRLTGQDLPDSPDAWAAWWKVNREGFQRKA